MSRRLIQRGLAALGLVALAPSTALAQDRSDDPVEEADDALVRGETAVFARYEDLGAAETEERLAELLESRDHVKTVLAISDALAADKVSPRELEAALLPLIKGLTEAESDRTLAALMLQHYLDHVEAHLASRAYTPADAFKVLDAGAEQLLAAAYGPADKRTRRLRHRI